MDNISETIQEKYLRLLNDDIKLTGNDFKENLNNLTHLLFNYYSEIYSASIITMSSNDLLKYLEEQELDPLVYSKTKEFTTKSDLVRFAGNAINETDFHHLYGLVEWILAKSKSDNIEKEDE